MTLAKQGNTVILHGRDIGKANAVFEEIKARTGNAQLHVLTADLSLISEVRRFAAEISSRFDRIDVLINNAGGQFGAAREVTSENREKTMAINVFAPYLLTKLLIPLLRKSEDGRVVTVSSASYTVGKFDARDIELETGYSLTRSYGLSKRYAYWVMQKYAQQGVKGVTFNTVEPGSADSDLGRESRKNKLANIVYHLWKPMMWSLEKAAATSIYLATSDEVKGLSGGFWGNLKEHRIKDKYKAQSEMDAVWDYCQKVCGE
jgi:NAD(P)-dependent dehydrogenase (short-subunit alcohol dehydrogenase family)